MVPGHQGKHGGGGLEESMRTRPDMGTEKEDSHPQHDEMWGFLRGGRAGLPVDLRKLRSSPAV